MKLTLVLSPAAQHTIERWQQPGESAEACADRLLAMLGTPDGDAARPNATDPGGPPAGAVARPLGQELSRAQQQVLVLLGTVGTDKRQRSLKLRVDVHTKRASICVHQSLTDVSVFETVNVSTVRALERRGLIRSTKRLGRGRVYTDVYTLTAAGTAVVKDLRRHQPTERGRE